MAFAGTSNRAESGSRDDLARGGVSAGHTIGATDETAAEAVE